MISDPHKRIDALVRVLYPCDHDAVTGQLVALAETYRSRLARRPVRPPTEATVCLITYADAIRRQGETPIHTLDGLLREVVGDAVTNVHLLPMYPWTSDDGFAVVDYRRINPSLGTWDDVRDLCDDYAVMFDFVANHLSSSSDWFRGWLADDPAYEDFFIRADAGFDTGAVVRPRTSPLFHDFRRPDGDLVAAWSTFGEDQVDVNIANPAVLLELTDVLLGYLASGAALIRLDAIGFLWKESGTACLHLPQTHAVIKLWRTLLDDLAPGVQLVTETNVPHAENVSYYGSGNDETHQVYQFALPPLVLHSFVSGSTRELAGWARGIGPVSASATWFNFLASHDGIGMRATEGILDDVQRKAMVERVLAHGGRVSMATRPDGSEAVYELNLTYLDALCTPEEVADPAVLAAKALSAHAILFSFLGVPAVYYHSLFGSSPDRAGMADSGINRRINREVLDADALMRGLTEDTRRRLVFDGLTHLMRVRREHPAFSPYGTQEVADLDDRVFAVRRGAGTPDELLCIANVTGERVTLDGVVGLDVVTGSTVSPLELAPYGFAWIRPLG